MTIKPADATSIDAWLALRLQLWPQCKSPESAKEIREILADPKQACFVACDDSDQVVGVIELGLRPFVDGCWSSPVGYIEGLIVAEPHRRQGVARQLVNAGLAWAKSQGCREIGSDADIDNQSSIDFHKTAGFVEIERHVVFLREL